MVWSLMMLNCGDGGRRQDWVNADHIDKTTWGAPCGTKVDDTLLEPGKRGLSNRVWLAGPEHAIGTTAFRCSLAWDNRTGKVFWLKLSGYPRPTRTDAEKVIGDLILPYLPPEVQLAARSVAFTPVTSRFVKRDIGDFHIQGHWLEGEEFELAVELGKMPARD
jgi:hypothetical protein